MFMLHAVFNKTHLKNIVEDLVNNGLPGITILKAFSKGQFGIKENGFDSIDENKKIKLELVVEEEKLEIAKEIIRSECQDLGYGAGKMWITPVLEIERIRTGEKNHLALKINKDKHVTNGILNSNFFSAEDTPNS